jgi:hypothetical protein
MKAVFAGSFAARMIEPVRTRLAIPCDLVAAKPGAFLINVARAEIFDEAALYEALASRRLAGAALDVWYRYPSTPGPAAPANLPFGELDNVIMTPHVSGWTQGTLDARARVIADNIARTARHPCGGVWCCATKGVGGVSRGWVACIWHP